MSDEEKQKTEEKPLTRSEVLKLIDERRRNARLCPACKSIDAVFHGKCRVCGSWFDDKGLLHVPNSKMVEDFDL